MRVKIVLTVLCLLISVVAGQYHECPFNKKDCQCYDDAEFPGDPYQFRLVDCKPADGQLPIFTPSPDGTKYNITLQLSIFGEVATIPANHFIAFENIYELTLQHNSTQSAQINWDDNAFNGVTIKELRMLGLDGIIPPPKVITDLPLEAMQVLLAPTAISFPDNAFVKLPGLREITTFWTKVSEIGQNALAGLENSLYYFGIYYSNLKTLTDVGAALKGHKVVELVEFPNNSITEIKKNDFANMPRFRTLSLNNNPITKIENGAFSNGLNNLRCLDLSRTKLPSIDLGLFSDIKRDWLIPDITNFNVFLGYHQYFKNLTTTVTNQVRIFK